MEGTIAHSLSSYRAEVLAIAIAVASSASAYICSDNQAAVRIATRLLRLPVSDREAALPAEHRDLWLFFLQCATPSEPGAHRVRWIPARRDWTSLAGRGRVLAFFNRQVDLEAKAALAERTADHRYWSKNGFISIR